MVGRVRPVPEAETDATEVMVKRVVGAALVVRPVEEAALWTGETTAAEEMIAGAEGDDTADEANVTAAIVV